MSVEPGYGRFEFELQMRPKSSTTDLRERYKLLQSVESNDRIIDTENIGVPMSKDIDILDDAIEDGDSELQDGGSEPSMSDDDDNEVEEAAEQEIFDEEHSKFDNEMNCITDRDMSDDEASGNEKYGSVRIVLITGDCSQVFSPATMSFIPMPTHHPKKRKALLDAYLFGCKFAYFENNCHIDPDFVMSLLSEGLWRSFFTPEETFQIARNISKELTEGILDGMLIVIAQWQTISSYPTAPTSRMQIELARTELRRNLRIAYFESLFEKQTPETDLWIVTVFEAFHPILEFEGLTFDKLLEVNEGKTNSYREGLVSQLATLAETHFVHAVIARAELQLVGHESIESLIDVLLGNIAVTPQLS